MRAWVGQQRETENTLHQAWAPALCGGVGLAGGRLAEAEVRCALYGDLFRLPGRHLAGGDPLIRAQDLDQFEQDLLAAWWGEAARTRQRRRHGTGLGPGVREPGR